jgi:hypothetical protein
MIDTRAFTITVPPDESQFQRQVGHLLRGLVMSRTIVGGRPIRREITLLEEPEARASVDLTWQRLRSARGQQARIKFILHRNPNGSVDSVRVTTSVAAPEVPQPSPPSPDTPGLQRQRQALIPRVEAAEGQAFRARQAAGCAGSRRYQRELTPENSRWCFANNMTGNWSDPGNVGPSARMNGIVRRELERDAERDTAAAERLRRQLNALDRQIQERQRRPTTSEYHLD